MSQALLGVAFSVLRLQWVAAWLWLEFLHTEQQKDSCTLHL